MYLLALNHIKISMTLFLGKKKGSASFGIGEREKEKGEGILITVRQI
jgi:hypothetical protein